MGIVNAVGKLHAVHLRARAFSSIIHAMKFYAILPVLCVTLCLTGCLSTEVSKSDVCGVEHVYASDYGWKFLNWLPLFRPDITVDRVQTAAAAEAAKRGKVLADVSYHNYENVLFEVPVLYFTIPIPYVICYYEVQLSGVLQ